PAPRPGDERHLAIPDAEPVLRHAVTKPMLNSTATTNSRRAVVTSAATSDGGSRRVMTSRTGCTASGRAASATSAGGNSTPTAATAEDAPAKHATENPHAVAAPTSTGRRPLPAAPA